MKEPLSHRCQCASCGESCRRLLELIFDTRPKEPPKDSEAKIWYERGKCTRFDLLFPFLTALVSLVDIAFDFRVAASHYGRGDIAWGSLTIAFAFVSLISIEIVSANWYIEDQRSFKKDILKKNGLEIKKWFYCCHFAFCGGLLRCCQIFRTVRMIRSRKRESPGDKERYRLYIAQLQDSSALGILEAFMEEAPQVSLQLYILLRRGSVDLTSFEDLIVALSIPKSLALFAFNLLIYARYIRLADEQSQQLNWFSLGSVFFFIWRVFMLTSRILALALFASYFTRFVFVIVGIHFAASYVLLWRQECEYFEGDPFKQRFFRCAIAYVHIFCFFPLESKNTHKWGYPYYILTLIENLVMIIWWTFVTNYGLKFRVAMLVTELATFLIGLISLILFYRYFHPSKHATVETAKDETDAAGRDSVLKIIYKRARWPTSYHNSKADSNGTTTAVKLNSLDVESTEDGYDI